MAKPPSRYSHGRSEIWDRRRVAEAAVNERRRLGLALRKLREGRDLTQAEAAERIGIHNNTLVRIEGGDANITLATLVAIALGYGVPLRALF